MRKVLIALALMFLSASTACAQYLVDTGTPSEFSPSYIVGDDGATQFGLAGRFELTQPSIVTGLEGYFDPYPTPGTLTAVLYGGDGGVDPILGGLVPNVSNELYSSVFTVGDTVDWYGVQGLSQNLPAGAYWLAFEGRPGNTFSGAMVGDAPNPLLTEAWKQSDYNNGIYNSNPDFPMGLGMRVAGSVVPEPLSCLLFLAGGSVLALKQKRKSKKV